MGSIPRFYHVHPQSYITSNSLKRKKTRQRPLKMFKSFFRSVFPIFINLRPQWKKFASWKFLRYPTQTKLNHRIYFRGKYWCSAIFSHEDLQVVESKQLLCVPWPRAKSFPQLISSHQQILLFGENENGTTRRIVRWNNAIYLHYF